MLARVTCRKHALHKISRTHERLLLPSVYPLLCRSLLTTKCGPARPSARHGVPMALGGPISRSLATVRCEVADDHSSMHIPFEGMDTYSPIKEPNTLPPQFSSRPPLSDPSDPIDRGFSSVIILDTQLSSKPPSLRKINSIGGNLDEMIINLDVSLSAGMFNRAGLLLRRLNAAYPANSSELLDLHNRYLRSMISYMIVSRQIDLVWYAQRWYEVDMRLLSVRPDAITIAWMLRMSLRMLVGNKRKRTVLRYWQYAATRGLHEDILQSSVLPEADIGLLSEICYENPVTCDDDVDPHSIPSDETLDLKPKVNDDSILPPNRVRITDQKGMGLESLKESLSLFESSTGKIKKGRVKGRTKEKRETDENSMRQIRLETDASSAAIQRWKKEGAGVIKHRSVVEGRLNAYLYNWYEGLVGKIKEELEAAKGPQKKLTAGDVDRSEFIPFLLAIEPSKVAAVTILSVLGSIGTSGMDKGIKLSALVSHIGSAIKEEYFMECTRQSLITEAEDEKRAKSIKRTFKTMTLSNDKARFKSYLRKEKAARPAIEWPEATEIKIGALLASMLFSTAEVRVPHTDSVTEETSFTNESAFHHIFQLQRGHNVGYVQLHESLVETLRKEPSAGLIAKHLPMVSVPRPWVSNDRGGFLRQRVPLVRTRYDEAQKQYIEAAAERGDLQEIYKGLTILGKTGWRINRPVFNVMLEAWNSGFEVANIVPADPNINYPTKPDSDDRESVRAYYRAKTRADNKKMSNHSQRCYLNFQMEIARAYLKESFYLPHNIDFRGRAYPLPPYFNQMGPDNCRGLLLFSEGRKLGESGLRWLRIHLANVFGFDKASFQEREQFSIDHVDDILDSANNGLKGKRWWLEAGDPFQCLAACMELRDALKLPNPAEYISHLPIHQDGSCNGLQHYAALGGDLLGAKQVNLEPGDRPSDIYTAVAEHVKATFASEVAAGHPIAKLLDGRITRKVVKQTVMTNVYGVTFIGATRQVRRQLADHYPDLAESEALPKCAIHVARAIFSALNSMFSGAHDIQFWLGDCANRVTRSVGPSQIENIRSQAEESSGSALAKNVEFQNTVIWTTPLKLPVVQPYRQAKVRQVHTTLQLCTLKDTRGVSEVNRRKQLQAFPPNFIHSLDATHMMLSAIKCDEIGLNFSAVHDSFWTHASDIDKMNVVLRDQFVRMHSDDIIGRLAAEFKARYANHLYLASLKPNSPLAKQIKKLRKARGLSQKRDKVHELLEEHKRMELLNSRDPAEQEKGRQMVTPGSIFAAAENSEDNLMSVQSLGVAAMGQVPSLEEQQALEAKIDSEDDLPLPASQDTVVPDVASLIENEEADEADTGTAAKKAKTSSSTWVWLPLTFRDVPKKGEFNVSRLKESQYFFS